MANPSNPSNPTPKSKSNSNSNSNANSNSNSNPVDLNPPLTLILIPSSADHLTRTITPTQNQTPIVIGRATAPIKSAKLKSHPNHPAPDNAKFLCLVMSKNHAQLSWIGNHIFIEDTDSTHGTYRKSGGSFDQLPSNTPFKLENNMILRFGRLITSQTDGTRHRPLELTVRISKPVLPSSSSGTYGLTDRYLVSEDDDDDVDEDDFADACFEKPQIGSKDELKLRKDYLSHSDHHHDSNDDEDEDDHQALNSYDDHFSKPPSNTLGAEITNLDQTGHHDAKSHAGGHDSPSRSERPVLKHSSRSAQSSSTKYHQDSIHVSESESDQAPRDGDRESVQSSAEPLHRSSSALQSLPQSPSSLEPDEHDQGSSNDDDQDKQVRNIEHNFQQEHRELDSEDEDGQENEEADNENDDSHEEENEEVDHQEDDVKQPQTKVTSESQEQEDVANENDHEVTHELSIVPPSSSSIDQESPDPLHLTQEDVSSNSTDPTSIVESHQLIFTYPNGIDAQFTRSLPRSRPGALANGTHPIETLQASLKIRSIPSSGLSKQHHHTLRAAEQHASNRLPIDPTDPKHLINSQRIKSVMSQPIARAFASSQDGDGSMAVEKSGGGDQRKTCERLSSEQDAIPVETPIRMKRARPHDLDESDDGQDERVSKKLLTPKPMVVSCRRCNGVADLTSVHEPKKRRFGKVLAAAQSLAIFALGGVATVAGILAFENVVDEH